MTSVKKMKLVPISEDELKGLKEVVSAVSISQSPNLKATSNLDNEIREILESNETDRNKVILYTQTLRKFLTYKDKFDAEDLIKQLQLSDIITQAAQSIVPGLANIIKSQSTQPAPSLQALIPQISAPQISVPKIPRTPRAPRKIKTPKIKTSSPLVFNPIISKRRILKPKRRIKNRKNLLKNEVSPIRDTSADANMRSLNRSLRGYFPSVEFFPRDFEAYNYSLKDRPELDSSINNQLEKFNQTFRPEQRNSNKRAAKTTAIEKVKEIASQTGSGIRWEPWINQK